MELPWIILAVVALAGAVAAFLWRRKIAEKLRKRRAERAREGLERAQAALQAVEVDLQPFLANGAYIPERIRRPFEARVTQLVDQSLPEVARVASHAIDGAMQDRLAGVIRRVGDLRKVLKEHNDGYVKKMVAAHSNLLVEELRTDEAQRVAIVRDDERNLVIAGAGSGKTRTIVSRIRFLLERKVPAAAILAVTFTNKATEEMQGRLKQMGVPLVGRGTEGVTVSTLHALGKRVVQATVSGPISVADDRWTDSLVAAALRDARESRDLKLAQLYINAILHFHRNEDERAPALGGEKTYRTLRGEHVRSIGERIIADFLLLHHVGYEYEAKASWAYVGEGHDAYHPDFKLLETGAHIEYWGVNRAGDVAAWMNTTSVAYRQGMAWKRAQFRDAGKVLLEFYEYERTEEVLEAALEQRLNAAGVALQPMTLAEVEKSTADMKYVGSAIERLLVQFVANARAMRHTPNEIRAHLGDTTPRVHHFGLLGSAVLERYEARLATEGRIDFSDMLHRAGDILASGTNPLPRFQHVLVDEFQDTSAAMARFLHGLLEVTGAHLFAVGDDWQAIYGFAGGDLDYIVNFESHFGPASTTMLSVNYRSPALIVEAGAALIAQNRKQVSKRVVVSSRERGEAFVHEVPNDDDALVDHTIRLVREELLREKSEDVLVLSRTNHILADIVEACRRSGIPVSNPERKESGVRILSAHKAKGLEAAVVIVVNASDHLLGFPSKVENPDVLEPVRMSAGDSQAEERRLFYVALTRANKRLHLVVRQGLPSPYLAEIEGMVGPSRGPDPAKIRVGSRFSGSFHVERLNSLSDRQVAAGIRQSGLLTTTTDRYAFTSWAPVDLQAGATYWLSEVIKERPFRDRQQVRLDQGTKAIERSPPRTGSRENGSRDLLPRPPPSHQPLLSGR